MIPLLIVDQARWMCETLAKVLSDEQDVTIIGMATQVEEALPHLETPNLILLSATLPNDGTLQVLKAVVSVQSCQAKVVVVDLTDASAPTSLEWEASAVDCALDAACVSALLKKIRAISRIQSRAWVRVSAPSKN